ncbi:hypothetical protein [Nocardiopsis coralliicola]
MNASAAPAPARSHGDRSAALTRVAGWTAAAHWLLYTAEKVYLASTGTIGMVGSPAGPDAYAEIPDAAAAQLGNAAMGAVAAAVVLLALSPVGPRLPRFLLLPALWAVTAVTAAAVALVASHGNLPHTAVSAVGLAGSAVFAYALTRHPLRSGNAPAMTLSTSPAKAETRVK